MIDRDVSRVPNWRDRVRNWFRKWAYKVLGISDTMYVLYLFEPDYILKAIYDTSVAAEREAKESSSVFRGTWVVYSLGRHVHPVFRMKFISCWQGGKKQR